MHHHQRRRLHAHLDTSGQPILESVICCCCEDDAANRIRSYQRAIAYGDFDLSSRKPLNAGTCAFCRKRVRA